MIQILKNGLALIKLKQLSRTLYNIFFTLHKAKLPVKLSRYQSWTSNP